MDKKLPAILAKFELTNIYKKYKNDLTYNEQQAMLRAIELQNINIQKAFAEIDVPYNMLYSNLSDEKFKKHIVRRMTNEFAKLIEENISFNRDIKTRTNEKTGGVIFRTEMFLEMK